MSAKIEKFCKYRGDIRAALSYKDSIIFVTKHPEDQPTALYRLFPEKAELKEESLPAGGLDLITDLKDLYIAGADGVLYKTGLGGGKVKKLGDKFEFTPEKLAYLSKDRLAALSKNHLFIVCSKKGTILQTFELEQEGTALASDLTGTWIAVGGSDGTLSVFECEDKKEFVAGDSQQIHQGLITSLLFEPEELRVISAGRDLELYITHVRGKLDPEIRTTSQARHKDIVTSMILGTNNKFYSGSKDGAVKTWMSGATKKRPVALKDVGKTVTLLITELDEKSHLVLVEQDNSFRFFPLNDESVPQECTLVFRDAYALAKKELKKDDTKAKNSSLKVLVAYNDRKSVDIIARFYEDEKDYKLKLQAVKVLSEIDHAQSKKYLEEYFKAKEEGIRVAAFSGLRKKEGENSLKPLKRALETYHKDIGVMAIKALEELASENPDAKYQLVASLNSTGKEIRVAALESLENFYGDDPEGDLLGANSYQEDIKKLALIRFFQRDFLENIKVQAAIRRASEDYKIGVRLTSFYITLLQKEKLANLLRGKDKNLHRKLYEIEKYGTELKEKEKLPKPKSVKLSEVEDTDKAPLFQAMVSKSEDISLEGAYYLALLGDSRAFGPLLKLSQARNNAVKVQVCKAFQELKEMEAVDRLKVLLHDTSEEVRDAAFSALEAICESDPVIAIEAGFTLDDQNIPRRSLKLLVAYLKKAPKEKKADCMNLLETSLNNSHQEIRLEAFKAVLNLKEEKEEKLRFALRSIHAPVREKVFIEIKSNIKNDWAWKLLLELFDDAHKDLRLDAFNYAKKNAKDKLLEIVEKALTCEFADVREAATRELTKNMTKGAKKLLVDTLNDKKESIRDVTINALVNADAIEELEDALDSSYLDVRIKAASVLARYGKKETFKPLLEMLTKERDKKVDKNKWYEYQAAAIKGLAYLQDQKAQDKVISFIQSDHAPLRLEAVKALPWLLTEDIEPLKKALKHSDKSVVKEAAYGLAFCGNTLGSSVIFSRYPQARELSAAVTLENVNDIFLQNMVNQYSNNTDLALVISLLLDMAQRGPVAKRCMGILSANVTKVRIVAAEALEKYYDKKLFDEYVVDYINNRNDGRYFKIDADTILLLSKVLAFGNNYLKVFVVDEILSQLFQEKSKYFNKPLTFFQKRYEKELKDIEKTASKAKKEKITHSKEELRDIAFGVYAGILGERYESYGGVKPRALRNFVSIAKDDKNYLASVYPVLVSSLRDYNEQIRKDAFISLRELGYDQSSLITEALYCEAVDVGTLALKILAEKPKDKENKKLLSHIQKNFTNSLEFVAYRTLCGTYGEFATQKEAVCSTSYNLREEVLTTLVKQSDEKKILDFLHTLLKNDQVKQQVALKLAYKKDEKVFDVLIEALLKNRLRKASDALIHLALSGTSLRLLEALENNEIQHDSRDLFHIIGELREEDCVDKLITFLEGSKADYAFKALLKISGYNQVVYDEEYEEDYGVVRFKPEQHPRIPSILVQMMEKVYKLGNKKFIGKLIEKARKAEGSEPDEMLALLCAYPDDSIRHKAVSAVAWRLKKLDGPHEPLVKALEHKDGMTKFLAAEGLALGGHKNGLTLLMTSLELFPEVDLRIRAVKALGELADEQALDTLLRIVHQPEHALADYCAEAIGHMASSDKAKEIFEVLSSMVKKKKDLDAQVYPLAGLRYFNTRESWILIREYAKDGSYVIRQKIAELLQHDDDDASREILIDYVKNDDDFDVVEEAVKSLRKMYGKDSLEPDYIFLQSPHTELEVDTMKRISEKGDAGKLMEVIENLQCQEYRDQILQALLKRKKLPVDDVGKFLLSTSANAVYVAASIIGRHGKKAVKKHGTNLVKALTNVWGQWEKQREKEKAKSCPSNLLKKTTQCCARIVWACGCLEIGAKEMLPLLIKDAWNKDICEEVILALSKQKMDAKILDALEKFALESHSELRKKVCKVLHDNALDKAIKIADKFTNDHIDIRELLGSDHKKAGKIFSQIASDTNYQSVVLPYLVENKEVKTLEDIAKEKTLDDSSRYGAIEALAVIADTKAQKVLREVALVKGENKELSKAAWRALRRAKRIHNKRTGANS